MAHRVATVGRRAVLVEVTSLALGVLAPLSMARRTKTLGFTGSLGGGATTNAKEIGAR